MLKYIIDQRLISIRKASSKRQAENLLSGAVLTLNVKKIEFVAYAPALNINISTRSLL